LVNVDKIKALAKEKGISITFICAKVGQQRSYLNDVKQGKTSIPPDRLEIIADILNTTPAYLKDETDQKEKPVDSTEELKVALFGGDSEVTDEMWQEVLEFAEFVKQKRNEKKK